MQPGAFYAPPPGMMVVSTNYVPVFRIVRTIGFTWGLIVRARGIGQTPRVRLSACVGASPRSGPCCPQRHHAPREPLPQRPDRPRAKPAPLWFRRGPEPPEEYEEPYDEGPPEEVFEPEYYPEDDFPEPEFNPGDFYPDEPMPDESPDDEPPDESRDEESPDEQPPDDNPS